MQPTHSNSNKAVILSSSENEEVADGKNKRQNVKKVTLNMKLATFLICHGHCANSEESEEYFEKELQK
jgi:hypothetical protein